MNQASRGRIFGISGFALAAAFCPLWVVAGCALNAEGNEEVTSRWERQEVGRPKTAESYARVPATRPSREGVRTQPADSQAADRLRDYILLALEQNPDILRAYETARAKAWRIPQATALADPMLMTRTLPEPVRTAEGDNYFTLGVTQKLPLPEKLNRAGRIALEETRMAIAAWEQTRLRVIADVKRAYFRIYIIDRTIAITEENQNVLRGLIDAVRGQVAAGARRQEDALRAQVELSSLQSRLIELHQERTASEAMLNTLLNRPPDTAIPQPEPVDIRRMDIELDTMLARAVELNPELARLKRQVDRDREAVKLARLGWWPDFTLGFEWMQMEPRDAFRPPPNPMTGQRPAYSRLSEDASDNWAITFGFNLPIWFDRVQAGIREAQATLAASMHEYVAGKNTIAFRIQDALANLRAQRELAELFETTIVPQARQAYEVSQSGYMAGRTDFQYVIDNWQKWLAFTIQYHRAVGELERSIADLEEAIGMSLSESGMPE